MKQLNKLKEMKQFLILWIGQTLSSLGSSMTSYALIIWVYGQKGTATSITLLSFFTFLPSILFCFIAGTLADRWDKKKIMLVSDLAAAMGTTVVLVLFSMDLLQIWHLYLVNFVISFMNAFQNPASYVATSLLIPKDQYVRASGLQAFSGSLVTILKPAFATALLALAGLKVVLIFDLVTFTIAFLTLLFFIKLPVIPAKTEENGSNFWESCLEGFHFLKEHMALLHLILFFAFINLLAHMTGFSLIPALILARTGNNQTTLGMVSTALGLGGLVGSIIVTIMKPAKNKIRTVFLSCAISYALCDPVLALGQSVGTWIFAAFGGNIPLPFLNANLTAIMRTNVPIQMQGRVFATRDTIQYSTIPVGLFLGGFLADHVFEPFMQRASPLQSLLSHLVGSQKGSGIAVMFLITGIIGLTTCLLSLKNPIYKDL